MTNKKGFFLKKNQHATIRDCKKYDFLNSNKCQYLRLYGKCPRISQLACPILDTKTSQKPQCPHFSVNSEEVKRHCVDVKLSSVKNDVDDRKCFMKHNA